uniref:hypothetical protein n=1 Tax=Enterobacter asburiae TaxID=61645 RepID=UPI001C9E9367
SRMFPLTPALSLKGEGVVRAGIILWGTLSPVGEGKNNTAQNQLSFPAFYLKTNRYERFIFIPLS